MMEIAKSAQKLWAKTPLWKRAELLHKAAAILKEHKAPIAECLVKEIAKPAKDAVTEVQNPALIVMFNPNCFPTSDFEVLNCPTPGAMELIDLSFSIG